MYSPPNEYAFATLYFTGSKAFNTVQRQRALNLGYTLNEHGFHHMVNKKKGAKLDRVFPTEKSIFDFLGMEYREPQQRIDGRSVKLISSHVSPSHSATPEPAAPEPAAPEPVAPEPAQETLIKMKVPKKRTLKKQKKGKNR